MTKCSGEKGCLLHPHIQSPHPAEPVRIVFADGTEDTVSYSDDVEAAEAAYQRFAGSDVGKAIFKDIHDSLDSPG
jgi:hypothetical protein